MTPSLALCTSGESVLTTIPGWTGQAHDATGFGALSTSTRHMRQLPAINSFLCRVSRPVILMNCHNVLMVAVTRDGHASLLACLDQS